MLVSFKFLCFFLFIYISQDLCVTIQRDQLEDNGNLKIDSNGNCFTTGETPLNDSILSFKSDQIISSLSDYPDYMIDIGNKVSNNTPQKTDLILLTYNLLSQLDQGNINYISYYNDIQKYFNWNETNWNQYNLTGKYKAFPSEVESIYNSLLNELTVHYNKAPRWLNLNAFSSAYFYVWLNSFKVSNKNETILIPLLSACYGYSTIFSLDSEPTILQVKKIDQRYEIISSIPYDAEIHFSYINSIEHLSNDILLLFNHSIIKANKYNTYELTFSLDDPHYYFYSYLKYTKYDMSFITKDFIKEQLNITITITPTQVNAKLFKLIMMYAECSKCSGHLSQSKSFEIQTIKNTLMYHSIVSDDINKTISKLPNGSLTEYIIKATSSSSKDDSLIRLFNLENLNMLYYQLTQSYLQIIRLQWHDLQSYKHKYINSL